MNYWLSFISIMKNPIWILIRFCLKYEDLPFPVHSIVLVKKKKTYFFPFLFIVNFRSLEGDLFFFQLYKLSNFHTKKGFRSLVLVLYLPSNYYLLFSFTLYIFIITLSSFYRWRSFSCFFVFAHSPLLSISLVTSLREYNMTDWHLA